jgi:hypothetical protein
MRRTRMTWRDRVFSEYETPSQTRCRHNGIPYKGGCGSLASNKPASKAFRDAVIAAVATTALQHSERLDLCRQVEELQNDLLRYPDGMALCDILSLPLAKTGSETPTT